MKILLISLVLLSSLYCDEMKRIQTIVADITELRADYKECKDELKSKKIINMSAKTSSVSKYKKMYQDEKQKNTILKAELDFRGDLLKSNKNLSARVIELEKQLLSKKNKFPELIMKNEVKNKSSKIKNFKPTVFRFIVAGTVYDGIDGNAIDKWEKHTSFTTSQKTDKWIKISGYFVNKKWKLAKKEMWVKIKQVAKK